MPKATISFSLPEEKEEYETTMKAVSYACALEDFRNYLRSRLKYEELTEEQSKTLDEVRTKFFEILADNEISNV